MLKKQSIRLGKLVKKTMQLRGGGSALPGLVVEKLNPHFLRDALNTLPRGVVVVSGTNGKTTTTKIIVQLLRSTGLRVLTNPSGSNFTRGIAASLLSHVKSDGSLQDFDIAVLELDEAHAVHFIQTVAPRYTLILNVLRDQLDRFGEIDHTAKLLECVVAKTTHGVVLNRDDVLVRQIATHLPDTVSTAYFGASDELLHLFPSDADLHGSTTTTTPTPEPSPEDVILEQLDGHTVTFTFGADRQSALTLKLDGIHNALNAAAALALVRMVAQDAPSQQLLEELASVKPAFGRGEAIEINGQPLEIVLVKNPSGFRLSLQSYTSQPAVTMIAINDLYADGRDMSWLWDVDFSSLQASGVQVVSGLRAYDMALRLQYDDIKVGTVVPAVETAVQNFIRHSTGPKRIYCTYTAMLALRRELARQHELEPIE